MGFWDTKLGEGDSASSEVFEYTGQTQRQIWLDEDIKLALDNMSDAQIRAAQWRGKMYEPPKFGKIDEKTKPTLGTLDKVLKE